MRLIVARCEVSYAGRLATVLPEAVRLLMVKARRHVHGLGRRRRASVKPLNWMTPPTVVEEEREDEGALRRLVVRKPRERGPRSRSQIAEVLSDVEHELDTEAALEKEGIERELQELLADAPAVVRRGLAARPPRVADRHRARGPDVPRRRGRVDRRGDQAHRRRSTRSSSSTATWSASGWTPRWAPAAGCSPRRRSSRRRACWRGARGIDCVEVDPEVLRGEREPDAHAVRRLSGAARSGSGRAR